MDLAHAAQDLGTRRCGATRTAAERAAQTASVSLPSGAKARLRLRRDGTTESRALPETHPNRSFSATLEAVRFPRLLILAFLFAALPAWGSQQYSVTGLVLKVDRAHRSMVVSCQEIPGYMDAMVMPFTVREAKALDSVAPGAMVDFTLVVDKESSYAEKVIVRGFESLAQEPLQARRLKLLEGLGSGSAAPAMLATGQSVPNFTLTDQERRQVSLAQFAGKVVAVNFVYTRCVLPDYCFRLTNNFGGVQRRFAERMGRDLILLTVTFDPVHDKPETMAKYAETWKANPQSWHFLTGSVADVQHVCGLFGVDFWPDEATLTHTLHTVVIDRHGKLVANIEGNQFTAQQLGDLVETVMNRGD